jgi:DNA-binding MarR family transcriptional regulator
MLLSECDAPLEVTTIADYLMLQKRTIWAMLFDLENRELLLKSSAKQDGRRMAVALTPFGRTLVHETRDTITALLGATFWRGLPEEELVHTMLPNVALTIVDLRGHAVEGFSCQTYERANITIDFLLFWRILIENWERAAHKRTGLPLSAARILGLISHFDGFSPQDIANRLLIESSGVSIYKKELEAQGYITETSDDVDCRKVRLCCTKSGYRVAKRLDGAFLDATHLVHRVVNDEGANLINAWYMRMYSNLMAGTSRTQMP